MDNMIVEADLETDGSSVFQKEGHANNWFAKALLFVLIDVRDFVFHSLEPSRSELETAEKSSSKYLHEYCFVQY